MPDLNHQQSRNYLHKASDGLLGSVEHIMLDAHLDACPDCRAYSNELNALQNDLHRILHARWDSNIDLSASSLNHINSRLRRKFMRKQILTATGVVTTCAILILVMVGTLNWLLPKQNRQPIIGVVETSNPASVTYTPVKTNSLEPTSVSSLIIPSSPTGIITYTVQTGDDLFKIADKFHLTPETILYSNYRVLLDDVHRLIPGVELIILPVNGLYYQVQEKDTLYDIAVRYKVSPEKIWEFPGNPLNGVLTPGIWLIIPGGQRDLTEMLPAVSLGGSPESSKGYGPGYCLGESPTMTLGTGSFDWPTSLHAVSGYAFSNIHPAVDLAGKFGDPVVSMENGVVVYAGWSNWGYGNIVVIDHGNSWISTYTNLNAVTVTCSQVVQKGSIIGLIGMTGNTEGAHLHLVLVHAGKKLDPLSVLP